MTMVEVIHFTDAGCPWCYSAEPVRIALEERYGSQLRWRNVQVGLHESVATMEDEGYTTAGLAESYRKIHERHGMPFCAEERPRLSGTWAGARAVKAAEMQGAEAGERLLRRLRFAWFAEVQALNEPGELRCLAAEVAGLDLARFERDLAAAASAAAFARDRAEARRPDPVALALEKTAESEDGPRYRTPSYVFSTADRSVSVPGFQPLEAYEVALQNLAPSLERRRAPDAAGFLAGHAGHTFATVEVAAAIGRSSRTAAGQLRELAGEGSIACTPVQLGELWSGRAS
jgi:predicted DsbA family dithiol-disulfide isomerase